MATSSLNAMTHTDCRIIKNGMASERYHLIELENAFIAENAKPGQFVMVKTRAGADPLLPRPLAIFDTDLDRGTFRLLYLVAGRGTKILAETHTGSLSVLGPLGRPFSLYPNADTHIAVGGGTGVAALYAFIKMRDQLIGELRASTGESRVTDRFTLLVGARSAWGLLDDSLTDPLGVPVKTATDDGTSGKTGTVVDLLKDELSRITTDGLTAALYTAGPEPMMRAVMELATQHGLPCRVSLENRMACGIGNCRGCVCTATTPHPDTGLMRRAVCTDGPVFDMNEIAWDA